MEKELEIDVKTFLEMFVAIGYLQEQRIFSYDLIMNMIDDAYWLDGISEHYKTIEYDDLLNEVNLVLNNMVNNDVLSIIYQNKDNDRVQYRITNNVNYKKIIEENSNYLADMIKVFYGIHGGKRKSVLLYPSMIKKINR